MKPIAFVGVLVAVLLLVPGCGPKAEPKSGVSAQPQAAAPKSYAAQLDALLPALGAQEIPAREAASVEWEKLCFVVGTPGRESDRKAVCVAMCARIGPETARPARIWMLRQLERIGKAESVGPVAKLLDENDNEIRDLARRVLQNDPAEAAGRALREHLQAAHPMDWQVALINALGARRDHAAVGQFTKLAGGHELPVAKAALAALGDEGSAEALQALRGLHGEAAALGAARADAILRCAARVQAAGNKGAAAQAYRELLEAQALGISIQIGALRGVAATDDVTYASAVVVARLADPNADFALRGVAAELAPTLRGIKISDLLAALDPVGQMLLCGPVADRGDAADLASVTALVASANEDVKLAAVKALSKLGDVSSISVLAQTAADSTGAVRDAARKSLARLRAKGVDEAVVAKLKDAPPAIRVELVTAIAARRYKAAFPELLRLAVAPPEDVQVAAFAALGELAAESDTPAVLKALLQARDEKVRTAAEDAVATVCNRIDKPEERARPVLAFYSDATADVRVSLMRVLGRVGGAAALAEIRKASQSTDEALQDAAIRGLAKWPGIEVLDELLVIARKSPNKTHRVLALQGCIRLFALPSERKSAATLALYKDALQLAERPEEQKAVLGGLVEVRRLDALKLAEQYLDNEALRAEAQNAVVRIAGALGPVFPDECRPAIARVVEATPGEELKKRADAALETIKKADGHMVCWLVAGPYLKDDLKGEKVFDEAFAPEQADVPDTVWEPLPVTNTDEPWVYNLGSLFKGDNRCVYVRTAVFCDRARPARLDLGSDDAVKAWLNGKLVHEHRGPRAHKAGEDKVAVQLERGWNVVLLKVVNYGGEYGFSAELTADGKPIEGVRYALGPESK